MDEHKESSTKKDAPCQVEEVSKRKTSPEDETPSKPGTFKDFWAKISGASAKIDEEAREYGKFKRNLILRTVATVVLISLCLSHVFVSPFLTYGPDVRPHVGDNTSHASYTLAITVFDTFHGQDGSQVVRDRHASKNPSVVAETPVINHDGRGNDNRQEPFCCLTWLKLVFFAGFAMGQAIMGFAADSLGMWPVMRACIKALIVAGMAASMAHNVCTFAVAWFVVATTSSATFMMGLSHTIESVDESGFASRAKLRILFGVGFHFAWNITRSISTAVVYLSNDWVHVLLAITIATATAFFALENFVAWDDGRPIEDSEEGPAFANAVRNNRLFYLNFAILAVIWFFNGFVYYALLHSWYRISAYDKMFEHTVTSTVLSFVSKLLALLVCCAVQRKVLPMAVLHLFVGGCFFALVVLPEEEVKTSVLVAHLAAFFGSATFPLLWTITVEAFPKKYRLSCLGLCSASARIGAIIGISLGELELLHLSDFVRGFIGGSAILIALLSRILPDMSKQDLPCVFADVEKVQFSKQPPTQRQKRNILENPIALSST